MPHFMIVLIPHLNLLNLSWIKNIYHFFEEYGAFEEQYPLNKFAAGARMYPFAE